jgi:hypothetical protein
MSTTLTHRFRPQQGILIKNGVIPMVGEDVPGYVVDYTASSFCGTCHCSPHNTEHHGDGSLCCPGPFYTVEYHSPCGRDATHAHVGVYAEHELKAPGT